MMRYLHVAISAGLLWSAACDSVPESESAIPTDPSTGFDKPSAPAVKRAVPLRISWPDETTLRTDVLSALSAEARAEVTRSAIPVMVPTLETIQAAHLETAHVIVRPQHYAFSFRDESITVSARATRLAHRRTEIKPIEGPDEVRSKPAFVTQNEAIWSVTFHENGVPYTVEVECAAATDVRCASDAFVREIAEQLVFVGGAR